MCIRDREYCLQWLKLAPEDQTRLLPVTLAGKGSKHRVELGLATSRLGQGAIAGGRVPDVQHKFRLIPVSYTHLDVYKRQLLCSC